MEETLAGRADGLKGYAVEHAVFGRDETFDASNPTRCVRFEARRLRRDLDSYYVDAGGRDPVRITIPKGGYVPHFEWHRAPTGAPPSDDADTRRPELRTVADGNGAGGQTAVPVLAARAGAGRSALAR